MKKFLLSLAVSMMGIMGLSAQTTIAAKQFNPEGSATVDGYTVTLAKNGGTNAPIYHANTDAIRLYAKGSLTVSGSKITKIEVTLAKDAGYRYCEFTPSTGAWNPAQAKDDTEITWVGDASTVTFTVADIATLGSENTKPGQIRFASITVYGEGGQGGDDPNPTPDPEPTGKGSEEDPYTAAELQTLGNPGTSAWVNGIIVGVMDYVDGQGNVFSNATPFTVNSNIVIASSATATDYVAVQLPAGDVRQALNLVDRPALIGKEVSVYGSLEKYCGIVGVKNTSKYSVVGGLPSIDVAEIATLTDFIDEQDENTYFKITSPVTVTYQSGSYLFITDGASSLEVYGSLPNTYTNGDQLSGIIGKFGYYKNMAQMTPQADSFGAPIGNSPVAPAEVTLDKVQMAQYVVVKNVNIVADGSNWNITDGTTTKQLFNRFNISGIQALEGATVTGIGAVYDDKLQLFPISIEGGQGGTTPVDPDPVPGDGLTINATALNVEGAVTISGYTITIDKAAGGTKPAQHEATSAVRLYADNTMTISGPTMTKIVFTLASDASFRYTTFTPSVGTCNQAEGDTEFAWEGNANDITFTVGHDATLGSDGADKRGQIRFTKLTIYGPEGAISEIEINNDGTMTIYNLRGQRLSAPVKGLNIINGRKVLVK